MITWRWALFDDLTAHELYEILKARSAVFVVEQDCAYQDIDDLDQYAWHLSGWREESGGEALAAYLRVVFPGRKYPEPSIGRVLTTLAERRSGLGKQLTEVALAHTGREYPGSAIRISAQHRLERFYSGFGFRTVSEPYDEDGIPHIEMLIDTAG